MVVAILGEGWDLILVLGSQVAKVLLSQFDQLIMVDTSCSSQHDAGPLVVGGYVVLEICLGNGPVKPDMYGSLKSNHFCTKTSSYTSAKSETNKHSLLSEVEITL